MKAIEFVTEAGGKFIFGRGGKPGGSHKGKVTRKFRCVSGPRKGRIVAKMSTCHALCATSAASGVVATTLFVAK